MPPTAPKQITAIASVPRRMPAETTPTPPGKVSVVAPSPLGLGVRTTASVSGPRLLAVVALNAA
jgi:hypothetical protein